MGAALHGMQGAARISLTACAVILAACAKPLPRAVFEVGEAVPAGTASAIVVPHYDRSKPETHVVGITRFRIESASVQPDDIGDPAVAFELVAEDRQTFRAFTAALIGREMALMVDREVMMVATVRDELPGTCVISFGANPPPPDEVKRLAEHLAHD